MSETARRRCARPVATPLSAVGRQRKEEDPQDGENTRGPAGQRVHDFARPHLERQVRDVARHHPGRFAGGGRREGTKTLPSFFPPPMPHGNRCASRRPCCTLRATPARRPPGTCPGRAPQSAQSRRRFGFGFWFRGGGKESSRAWKRLVGLSQEAAGQIEREGDYKSTRRRNLAFQGIEGSAREREAQRRHGVSPSRRSRRHSPGSRSLRRPPPSPPYQRAADFPLAAPHSISPTGESTAQRAHHIDTHKQVAHALSSLRVKTLASAKRTKTKSRRAAPPGARGAGDDDARWCVMAEHR